MIFVTYWRRRRARRRERLTRRGLRLRRSSSQLDPAFINRDIEQDRFRELTSAKAAGDGPTLLIVTGAPGMGKRTLLARFQAIADAESHLAAGPVIDLGEPPELDQMLERIADQLARHGPAPFNGFFTTLDRFRDTAAGEPSLAEQTVELGRSVAKSGVLAGPVGGVAKAAIESPVVERTAKALEGASDLEALKSAFLTGLGSFREHRPEMRIVLFFARIDALRDHPTAKWVRDGLISQVDHPRILFVVSADDREVHGLTRDRKSEVMRLWPLGGEEAQRFAQDVIGLSKASILRDVVERSEGSPERLAGYKSYFDQNPDARERDRLPEDADTWAAGSVYVLVDRLEEPYRRLVLLCSPLRWFNSTLLRQVAAATLRRPDGEEKEKPPPPDPAALIEDPDIRPTWIIRDGAGWVIDDPSRRQALDGDLRHLDPETYRVVHGVAARYHRNRLALREEKAAKTGGSSGDPPLFEYTPQAPPEERFDDEDYVATLAEWLYHLLALDPDRAFPLVTVHAAEAMFQDSSEAAAKILDIRLSTPSLRSWHRLYLSMLGRANTALRDARQAEAVGILRNFYSAGAPHPLARAAVAHLAGRTYWDLGQYLLAEPRFEQAAKLFGGISGASHAAVRMRCLNATWLANLLAGREGGDDAARRCLRRALREAKELGEAPLIAEIRRAQALILEEGPAALRGYDEALRAYQDAGRPSEVAFVRRDRALVFQAQGDWDSAAQELDLADTTYQGLEDHEGRMEVSLQRLALFVRRGQDERAKAERDVALGMATHPAPVHNRIGVVYLDADRTKEAVEEFDKAIELADDQALYHLNRGHALARIEDGHDEALKSYQRARELARENPDVVLVLAQFQSSSDPAASQELFGEHGRMLLRLARDAGEAAEGAPSGLPEAFRGPVNITLEWLEPQARVPLLISFVESFPNDGDLRFRLGKALRELESTGGVLPGGTQGTYPRDAVAELDRAAEIARSRRAPEAVRREYLLELADALAERGETDRVQALIDEAGAADEDERARTIMARVRRRQRRDQWAPVGADVWTVWAVRIEVASDLQPWVDPGTPVGKQLYDEILAALRTTILERTGITIPPIRVQLDEELPARTVRISIYGVPRATHDLLTDYLAKASAEECKQRAGVGGFPDTAPWDGAPATWVGPADLDALRAAGIAVWDVRGFVAAALAALLESQLERFVGVQQVADLIRTSRQPPSEAVPFANLPHLVAAVRLLVRRGVRIGDIGGLAARYTGSVDQTPAQMAAAAKEEVEAAAEVS